MLYADVFTKIGTIAAVVGVVLIVPSLLYAGRQLRASQRVARGDFLLRLDEMLNTHDDVHGRLRLGGEWASEGSGPTTRDEWIAVERYEWDCSSESRSLF
jgi:hypothetical protein